MPIIKTSKSAPKTVPGPAPKPQAVTFDPDSDLAAAPSTPIHKTPGTKPLPKASPAPVDTLEDGQEQAMATVELHYPDGTEKSFCEAVGDPVSFVGPCSQVKFALGLTRSLGEYEFIRMDVGLTLPVPHGESLDDAFDFAKGWVDARLEQVSSEVDSELNTAGE